VIIDAKLGGVIAMFGAIAILFVLPWIDKHPIRSARFRPFYKLFFLLWVANVFLLGYLGAMPADGSMFGLIPYSVLGLLCTAYYFAYFIVILPLLNKYEPVAELPKSIHDYVLEKNKSSTATA
jgi:ubiquinol-cytochrome c reductase cytochrome b subunit